MVFINFLLFCFLFFVLVFFSYYFFPQISSSQDCPLKTIRSDMNCREAVTTEDTHPSIKLGHSDQKSCSFVCLFVFVVFNLSFDQC